MTGALPQRCQLVIWRGALVVLGEVEGGGFGIWSAGGGEPLAIYPQNDVGWNTATHQWLAWERPAPPPTPAPTRHLAVPVSSVIVIVVLVVLYIAYHSYKYQDCIVTPGLFSWPSRCI